MIFRSYIVLELFLREIIGIRTKIKLFLISFIKKSNKNKSKNHLHQYKKRQTIIDSYILILVHSFELKRFQ